MIGEQNRQKRHFGRLVQEVLLQSLLFFLGLFEGPFQSSWHKTGFVRQTG